MGKDADVDNLLFDAMRHLPPGRAVVSKKKITHQPWQIDDCRMTVDLARDDRINNQHYELVHETQALRWKTRLSFQATDYDCNSVLHSIVIQNSLAKIFNKTKSM